MTRFFSSLVLFGTLFLLSIMTPANAQINPQGKPGDTGVGKTEHYEVWHDQSGWHVRTFTKEYDHHFRGSISVQGGEFEKVKGFKQEHKGATKDAFVLGPENKKITFDFSTKGSVDGVDFHVKGETAVLKFNLLMGQKEPKFEPARIFIGEGLAHPSGDPFELPAHVPKK